VFSGWSLDLVEHGDVIHVEFIVVFSGLLFLVFGEQVILWCVFPCEVDGGLFYWVHSRSGYDFWVSNKLRTFFDNFTYLVCMELYCGAYFGSYLHFIFHIEYNDKVNLQGIGHL
jgi:hypothetical protein